MVTWEELQKLARERQRDPYEKATGAHRGGVSKTRYRTRKEAKQALKRIQKFRNVQKRREGTLRWKAEESIYRCEMCDGFHLTSRRKPSKRGKRSSRDKR